VYAEVGLEDGGAEVEDRRDEVTDVAEEEPEVGTATAVVDDDEGRADVDGCT